MTQRQGIGARVRKLRVDRAWSQEQLAEIAEVTTRTIQRLENEENCSLRTIYAVANAFGIQTGQLTSLDQDNSVEDMDIRFILRMTSGQDICQILATAGGIAHDCVEPENDDEVEMIGSFVQDICDTSDGWMDMSPKHRIEVAYQLTKALKALAACGLYVFADLTRQCFFTAPGSVGADKPWYMNVARILIIRSDNPAIVDLSPSAQAIAAASEGSQPTRSPNGRTSGRADEPSS